MVDGITILNKTAITGLPSWIITSSVVILIIGLIVLVVAILTDWPAWTAIITFVGLFVFIICGILDITVKTGEYRYECTIDDSVSYNEVVENYKIIKQRGDIWVLEDK